MLTKEEILQVLEEEAEGIFDGDASDIKNFLAVTAEKTVLYSATPDTQMLVAEVRAQLKGLLGHYRVRATDAGWSAFERVVGTIIRIVLRTA